MTRYISREHRDFAERVAPLGWKWGHAKCGHLAWRHPRVLGTVFTSATPRNGWRESQTKLDRALAAGVAGSFVRAGIERRRAA